MSVDAGDRAPGFSVPGDGGGTVSLEDYRGRTVVLYFYSKDDTPGCTREACGFRDALADFSKLDAAVIGVSKDPVARHDRFKARHGLPFALASDEDGAVCEAYGTWVRKKLYGREYMGIDRATFLIDGDGRIRNVWRKVRVPGHVEAVLEAAKAL